MTAATVLNYISQQWKTISKRCSFPLNRKVLFHTACTSRMYMRFFYGVSMQQIIKIQVKLSKRKIAVLYLLYAINAVVEAVEVVSDVVAKKIIKISVKVVPVENKESTSAG